METELPCWYSAALGNVLLQQERGQQRAVGDPTAFLSVETTEADSVQNLWGCWWWSCLWVPFPLLCHYMCYPTCHLWVRKTLFSGGRAVILKSLLKITWDWHVQTAAAVRKRTEMQCDAIWRNEVRDASQEFCFMWIVIKVQRRTSNETGAKKSHKRKHFSWELGCQVNCHVV